MSNFETALNTKDFVITSEVLLGSRSGDEHVREHVELLSGHVDAMLATDNQSGRLHISSLATSVLLQQAGIEPIMQLGCRNRNRVALLGDLLGAYELGIRNVQLVRGERVPEGFKPRPKAELDVEPTELIAIASRLKEGDGIASCPDLFLGGVTSARSPQPNWPARRLIEKLDAGARFMLTHTCMDIDVVNAWFSHLVKMKLTYRARFMASVVVLTTLQDAHWLQENKPNAALSPALVERLQNSTDKRREGIVVAAEMLRKLMQIPGVAGAHVYAPADLTAIPEVIELAGLAG